MLTLEQFKEWAMYACEWGQMELYEREDRELTELYVAMTIPDGARVDGWAEDLTDDEVESIVKSIVNQCATEFEARLGPDPEGV